MTYDDWKTRDDNEPGTGEDDPGPELCWCLGRPRYIYLCAACISARVADTEVNSEREREDLARHRALLFGSEE